MLSYYLLKIASQIVPLIPPRVGYAVASFFGDLAYLLRRKSRSVVYQNMKHALAAEVGKKRLSKTARTVFRNAAKNYFDLLRISRVDLERLEQIVTVYGRCYLDEAVKAGKGVILATAHLGNFDMVAQLGANHSPKLSIMVEPLQPAPLFRLVTGLRQSRGLSFLPAGLGGLRAALRCLQRGEIIALVCDRNIQGDGLKLDFLGEETSVPSGAVDLALRTGAAILPAFSIRQTNDHFSLYVEPALNLNTSDNHGDNLRENAQRLLCHIEKYVRSYPEQWVVFQPIWGKSSSDRSQH